MLIMRIKHLPKWRFCWAPCSVWVYLQESLFLFTRSLLVSLLYTRLIQSTFNNSISAASLISLAYTMSNGRNVSFSKFIGSIISLVLGMASFAMFCITADSVYYGTLSFTADGQPFESVSHVLTTLFDPTALITIRPFGNIVVTPLNNLIYNMNTENLALHGIHPRYTHFAINLPLLYGPLFIFGFLYIPNALVKIRNDTNAHLFYGKAITTIVNRSKLTKDLNSAFKRCIDWSYWFVYHATSRGTILMPFTCTFGAHLHMEAT
jgi:hypothetical protein